VAGRCYGCGGYFLAMSQEQIKSFLEKVKADTGLQEKIKAASNPEEISALAQEAGYSISIEDLQNTQVDELSNDELEAIAGGATQTNPFSGCKACGSNMYRHCA